MQNKLIVTLGVIGIVIGGLAVPTSVVGAKSPAIIPKKEHVSGTNKVMQAFFDLFSGKKNRAWDISDTLLQIEYNHREQTLEEIISSISEANLAEVKKLELIVESELTVQDHAYLNTLNNEVPQLEECILTFSKGSISRIGNAFYIPWCKQFISNVEIIGDNAFKNADFLKEANLAEAKVLGYAAFSGASSLSKLSVPNLEELGELSFTNTTSLEDLEIGLPESVFKNIEVRTRSNLKKLSLTNVAYLVDAGDHGIRSFPNLEYLKTNSKRIGDSVLWGFGKLEVVDMPNATLFGKNAFKENSALREVSLPKATEFEDDAFESATALKEIHLPNVTRFGARAFNHASSLEEVILPKVETFQDFAFYEAHSLKEVHFPNVTDFGDYAFYKSLELEKVTLPKVTSFGANAFGYVTGMAELSLPEVEVFGANAFYETEIGIVNLPSVRTLPNTSFMDSTIGFIKVVDVPTIDYEAIFSNVGSAIGIVENGTSQYSVAEGERLTLDYTPTLYNLENHSSDSWGLTWIKDGENLEYTKTALILENIKKEHAGKYRGTIWSTTFPTLVETVLDLHVVLVRDEEETESPENKEDLERNSTIRAHVNLSEVPTPPGPGPTNPIEKPETLPTETFFGINYVSNLDFGEITFSEEENVAITKWDADLIGEEEEDEARILSYLSVRDFRSDQEREAWMVTVVRDSIHFIKGGELTLYPNYSERGSFGEGSENDFILPRGITINDSPRSFVEAEHSVFGHSAFTLGEATLSIPAFTGGGDYFTVLTWNLIIGPS